MTTLNRYCVFPHNLENGTGVCYYDFEGNWISVNASTKQEFRNTLRFVYDNEGKLIPLSNRRIVRDNVRTVKVPPNLLTTFYSDFACSQILGTVGGTGLKNLGIRADKYGMADVPTGTKCITVSNEYYLNQNITETSTTVSNNNPDTNDATTSTNGTSLLWLQILIGILVAIAVILVAIAYYQFWKRRQQKIARETKETRETREKKEIKLQSNQNKSTITPQENFVTQDNYPKYLNEYQSVMNDKSISNYISQSPQVQIEGYNQTPKVSFPIQSDALLTSTSSIPKIPQVAEQSSMLSQAMNLPTTF